MKHADRFIVAIYYAIGGVVLGFGVAFYFSLYLHLEIGSAQIVFSSIILCFLWDIFFLMLWVLYLSGFGDYLRIKKGHLKSVF